MDKLLTRVVQDGQSLVDGANPTDITAFEQSLGSPLPAFLRNLLLKSNGGDFCFGRFERTPFVTEDLAGLTRSQLCSILWDSCPGFETPPQNLLPLCSDYSTGMYCLDLSKSPPFPVVFLSWDDDCREETAPTFEEFVADAAKELP